MAQSVKLSDGSYIDASAVWNQASGMTQAAVNSEKFDKAGGTIAGNVILNGGALWSKKIEGASYGQLYPLPRVPCNYWGTLSSYAEYYQNLIKLICAQYPRVIDATWIGTTWPGQREMMILCIYNTSTVDSNGVPRYAFATVFHFKTTTITNYGYHEYTWYEYTVS